MLATPVLVRSIVDGNLLQKESLVLGLNLVPIMHDLESLREIQTFFVANQPNHGDAKNLFITKVESLLLGQFDADCLQSEYENYLKIVFSRLEEVWPLENFISLIMRGGMRDRDSPFSGILGDMTSLSAYFHESKLISENEYEKRTKIIDKLSRLIR
jgi:hypothetical protein